MYVYIRLLPQQLIAHLSVALLTHSLQITLLDLTLARIQANFGHANVQGGLFDLPS